MLNDLEIYRDAGAKAARAMNRNQGEEFRFHADHMRRMLALETDANRPLARAAYDEAYSANRNIVRVR